MNIAVSLIPYSNLRQKFLNVLNGLFAETHMYKQTKLLRPLSDYGTRHAMQLHAKHTCQEI